MAASTSEMAGQRVRHALAADLDLLERTLGTSFADDPLMSWIYRDATRRLEQSTGWWRLGLAIGLTRGHTYLADDGRGAAIWSPPDVEMFTEGDGVALYELVASQIGDAAGPVMEGLMQVGAAHPEEPHFYLFSIGVLPEARGKGVAGALLRDMLTRCDAEGIPAYLESSNPENIPLYERRGFRVTGELTLPDGPTIHPMWRDPAG